MKYTILFPMGVGLCSLLVSAECATAQGTAFTYQGRLTDAAVPANGSYDLRLALFNTISAGVQVGGTLTNASTLISNGLFTIMLDFGTNFPGADRWLEIGVRTNGGGAFATLTPRQKLTPTPYAITAGTLGGSITADSFGAEVTNRITGDADTLSSSKVYTDTSIATEAAARVALANSVWSLTGNSGTTPGANFLGTTDNQPVELRVNGMRALRLEPNTNGAPNVVGGSPINFADVGVVGATIGGGGATNYGGLFFLNRVFANFGTIGGGADNRIDSNANVSTIAGGNANIIFANCKDSTIGGGDGNLIDGSSSTATIGGGSHNTIGVIASHATISGGVSNLIQAGATAATIPGGFSNSVAANFGFAAGSRARVNHQGTFVWSDSQGSDYLSTGLNQFLIRAAGGVGINTIVPPVKALDVADGSGASGHGGNIHVGRDLAGSDPKLIHFGDLHPSGVAYVSVGEAGADDRLQLGGATVLFTNFSGGTPLVGIGRVASANALEVEGSASKSVAGSWLANSDARIKTDVQTVSGALDKLDQVRLVQFRYTDEYRAAHRGVEDRSYLNVVAQEFQKVFPDQVKRSGEKLPGGDDILQVDSYPLTIYSAAAIQELHRVVKQQENTIQTLKQKADRVEELEQRLAALEKRLSAQAPVSTERKH